MVATTRSANTSDKKVHSFPMPGSAVSAMKHAPEAARQEPIFHVQSTSVVIILNLCSRHSYSPNASSNPSTCKRKQMRNLRKTTRHDYQHDLLNRRPRKSSSAAYMNSSSSARYSMQPRRNRWPQATRQMRAAISRSPTSDLLNLQPRSQR